MSLSLAIQVSVGLVVFAVAVWNVRNAHRNVRLAEENLRQADEALDRMHRGGK